MGLRSAIRVIMETNHLNHAASGARSLGLPREEICNAAIFICLCKFEGARRHVGYCADVVGGVVRGVFKLSFLLRFSLFVR